MRHAVQEGILLVPADRRGAAIVTSLSVRANLCLGDRVRRAVRRFGLRWPREERAMAQYYIERLSVRPPYADTRIGALSGGNQQKIAIARALEGDARVLLIEEPTQGVDVHAKAEIHSLLRRVAVEKRLRRHHRDVRVRGAHRSGRRYPRHARRPHGCELPGSEATYHRILENALS